MKKLGKEIWGRTLVFAWLFVGAFFAIVAPRTVIKKMRRQFLELTDDDDIRQDNSPQPKRR